MTPEQFTEELQRLYGAALHSVILYGSAAAGDHVGKHSDYNVLVVLERLERGELHMLAPLARRWMRQGNPPPLLFTRESLAHASSVFPLEIADIKDAHRILHGHDAVDDLRVDTARLRFQLAHELQGKLTQLRNRYLAVAGHPRDIKRLLVDSVSTFLILFRGALRLYQPQVPPKKLDALTQLAAHVSLDLQPFQAVLRLKMGARLSHQELEQLLADYLLAVESLVGAVERGLQSQQ